MAAAAINARLITQASPPDRMDFTGHFMAFLPDPRQIACGRGDVGWLLRPELGGEGTRPPRPCTRPFSRPVVAFSDGKPDSTPHQVRGRPLPENAPEGEMKAEPILIWSSCLHSG